MQRVKRQRKLISLLASLPPWYELLSVLVLCYVLYALSNLALFLSVLAGFAYVGMRYRKRKLKMRELIIPDVTVDDARAVDGGLDTVAQTSVQVEEIKSEAMLTDASDYRIPPPPPDMVSTALAAVDAQWIKRNNTVDIGGLRIAGGMIYVGQRLPGLNGKTDPALINPAKSIDFDSDYGNTVSFHWPGYADALPQQRGAYLRWLADGRSSPEADTGYVLAFFYGLERRVLLDAEHDGDVAAEISLIVKELKRLHKHYGSTSALFSRHCTWLWEWLELRQTLCAHARLYTQPMPLLPDEGVLPLYLRVALSQACVDQVALTPDLAWAWLQHDPAISLRTAATRCPHEFETLFRLRYAQLSAAIRMPVAGPQRLDVPGYAPLSPGLRSSSAIQIGLGDLPDVTGPGATLATLQEVVERCTNELDAYSRFIGRQPERLAALDAWVLLPPVLWPATARQALAEMPRTVGESVLVLSLTQLAAMFGSQEAIGKDANGRLALALAEQHIVMQPDLSGAASGVALPDRVALYRMTEAQETEGDAQFYQTACLSLELLLVMAQADGVYDESKLTLCRAQVATWPQLSLFQQRQMMASISLFNPMSPAVFRRRSDALTQQQRNACLACIIGMAAEPATGREIALLERVCTLLDIDHVQMYSRVHAAATALPMVDSGDRASIVAGGLSLDLARIAALKKESEHLATMLADIFQEEPVPQVAPAPVMPKQGSVPGLDAAHAAFATQLLARPSWQRSELEALAQTAGLMPDGALERLNEACFDAYDMPFTEGDDPIDINPELHERLA